MVKKVKEMEVVASGYGVTISRSLKTKATVLKPKVKEEEAFVLTYETSILPRRSHLTGMMHTCTCRRHIHGLLCEHIVAHLVEVGGYDIPFFVPK